MAALIVAAGPVLAEDRPISAIDWLSDSVARPAAAAVPPREPAVSASALPSEVITSRLGNQTPDAVGLLPARVTGLPRNFWGPTAAADLGRQIRAERSDMTPALQALFLQILLAEVDPPYDSDGRGALLLARLDALLSIGALDQAQALVDRAGMTSTPEIFRRGFDIALLIGTEDRACKAMARNPQLSPTYAARIFCLARNGDWDTAALTLGTARALGYIPDQEDALLSRFLDPTLYEGEPLPELPGPMTPLTFRMFEGIGEPQPTGPLPRAFAFSDLRSTAGWKAQIEAAERLVRAGALDPEQLRGLYTERKPAASGGVWDRAAAIQALEEALDRHKADQVSKLLPEAWREMAVIELEPALAAMVAPRLAGLKLDAPASAVAFHLALMTPGYETAALRRQPLDASESFLIGLARGTPPAGYDPISRAVAAGFAATTAPARAQMLIAQGRTGEAALRAMTLVTQGANGQLDELRDGLALLRALGFEMQARRAALEILVLDRRG